MRLLISIISFLIAQQVLAQVDYEVFDVAEQMPYIDFEQCRTESQPQNCHKTAFLEFIYNNFKAPKEAVEYDIQGKIIVSFVVNADGSTSNYQILKDVGAGCGEEFIRVLQLLAQKHEWVAGKQNGVNVNVLRIVPFTFCLK